MENNQNNVPNPDNMPPLSNDDKPVVILSYLFLLFLIPLLTKKDSAFAQYHAKQGLVLTICWFIAPLTMFLAPLAYLFCLVMVIIGIMNVVNNKMTPLPLIGQFAEKFKL